MKYQKPKVVAKSASKQSFVAGCPEKVMHGTACDHTNAQCMCGPLK